MLGCLLAWQAGEEDRQKKRLITATTYYFIPIQVRMRNVCWGIRNKKNNNNREYEDEGEQMRLNAAMDTYFVQRGREGRKRKEPFNNNFSTNILAPDLIILTWLLSQEDVPHIVSMATRGGITY